MNCVYTAKDLTVVVPAKNAASTIAATMASLLSQSAGPPRVLVVNDASDDETAAVVMGTGAATLLDGPGIGPGAARNVGITASETPLIAFCDADDVWPPQRLVMDLAHFNRDDQLEVLLGRTRFVADEPALFENRRFPGAEPITSIPHFGAATMRRETFARIGMIDEHLRHFEDYEWFQRAQDLGACLRIHGGISQTHRLHAGSWSRLHPSHPGDLIATLHRSLQRRRIRDGVRQD